MALYEARVKFTGQKLTFPKAALVRSLKDIATVLSIGTRHISPQNSRAAPIIMSDTAGLRSPDVFLFFI